MKRHQPKRTFLKTFPEKTPHVPCAEEGEEKEEKEQAEEDFTIEVE